MVSMVEISVIKSTVHCFSVRLRHHEWQFEVCEVGNFILSLARSD